MGLFMVRTLNFKNDEALKFRLLHSSEKTSIFRVHHKDETLFFRVPHREDDALKFRLLPKDANTLYIYRSGNFTISTPWRRGRMLTPPLLTGKVKILKQTS